MIKAWERGKWGIYAERVEERLKTWKGEREKVNRLRNKIQISPKHFIFARVTIKLFREKKEEKENISFRCLLRSLRCSRARTTSECHLSRASCRGRENFNR